MTNKYKVTVEEIKPYNVKDVQYEAEDGKIYTSEYSVPKEVKFKKVSYETGAVSANKREVYIQEIEEENFDLKSVIQAVNRLT